MDEGGGTMSEGVKSMWVFGDKDGYTPSRPISSR